MYIQESLTTTPHEVPGISWELPAELESKFWAYGAFAKLVFNADKTAVIDIVEDTARREAWEAERAREAAGRAAQAEAAALETQGVRVMARVMFRSRAGELTSDEVIRCRALAGTWEPGIYQVGDVRTEGGTPYRCCQAHDSTGNDAWSPSQARSLWAAYHGTTPETALPWAAPTGAHDLYRKGECMVWTDGRVLRAVQDSVFSPEAAPAAWEEV